MSRTTLTEARIRALKPRKTAYILRDIKLRGFGLRVLPSGRKGFVVHCQHRDPQRFRARVLLSASVPRRSAV